MSPLATSMGSSRSIELCGREGCVVCRHGALSSGLHADADHKNAHNPNIMTTLTLSNPAAGSRRASCQQVVRARKGSIQSGDTVAYQTLLLVCAHCEFAVPAAGPTSPQLSVAPRAALSGLQFC